MEQETIEQNDRSLLFIHAFSRESPDPYSTMRYYATIYGRCSPRRALPLCLSTLFYTITLLFVCRDDEQLNCTMLLLLYYYSVYVN